MCWIIQYERNPTLFYPDVVTSNCKDIRTNRKSEKSCADQYLIVKDSRSEIKATNCSASGHQQSGFQTAHSATDLKLGFW